MRVLSEVLLDSRGEPLVEAWRKRSRDTGSPWKHGLPLPLIEVDYTLEVDPNEISVGQSWPPPRFDQRVERLERFHEWSRGDLSSLIDPAMLAAASVAPTNVFRRVAKFVADLLVMARPTVTGEDDEWSAKLLRVCHDAVYQTIKYGTAFVVSNTMLGWFRVIDARYVLRRNDGGWVIAEPRVTAVSLDQTPDLIQLINVEPTGEATMATYRNSRNRVGVGSYGEKRLQLGEERSAAVNVGQVTVAPIVGLPSVAEVWGTSWFEDLATIVVQQTRRTAINTLVLDANSHPILFLKGMGGAFTNIKDGRSKAAAAGGRPVDITRQGEELAAVRHGSPILSREGLEDAKYVTWDGNLEASMTALDKIAMQLRFMSGLPAAMESDQAIPSGVSLKRMFWQLYASVSPLYHGAHDALRETLELWGQELEWENVFEQVENAPVMTANEEVMDEATADRGAGNPIVDQQAGNDE